MHIKFLFVFHSPLIQSRDNWISPSLILTPWGRNLIIADFYLVHALMVSTSAVRTPSKIFSKQFFKRGCQRVAYPSILYRSYFHKQCWSIRIYRCIGNCNKNKRICQIFYCWEKVILLQKILMSATFDSLITFFNIKANAFRLYTTKT